MFSRLWNAWGRVHAPLYVVWAAFFTLASARLFYGYMMKQTGGEWSAPLDDVFIHFDYARSIARGAPLEWVVGNGYSSGNTSLTYPFALAVGYVAGFDGDKLMIWAALVACVSVFAWLLACYRVFFRLFDGDRLASLSLFVFPPLTFGVGALCWSLWSGMEVAFFLAAWAAAFVAADRIRTREGRGALLLGALCTFLCATRPEAATTTLCFGIFAASGVTRLRARIRVLLLVGAPPALLLGLQAFVNARLTGDTSASGALVKLALFNPYMSPSGKWHDFVENLRYASMRCIEYHFAEEQRIGLALPALALFSLTSARVRAHAALLLGQVVTWFPIVALNGQVRWQNERYVMPGVAWLVVAAALGFAVLVGKETRPSLRWSFAASFVLIVAAGYVTHNPHEIPVLRTPLFVAIAFSGMCALAMQVRAFRISAAALALATFYLFQRDHFRGQKWFFGRAARNIRDQQTTLGRALTKLPENAQTGGKRRVLVGDAGAILYASDWGGLDIIGLGGYKGLPFARASQHGLAATIELLEYVPEAELPEFLAIFPSWWDMLPHWFAAREEKRFPAEGNVICGDYEHVLYRADWHLLGTGKDPKMLPVGMRDVKDTLDVADIVSERAHGYKWAPVPNNGWAIMKTLRDPARAGHEMWDAGRRIHSGSREQFTLSHLERGKPAALVLRSAPENSGVLRVLVQNVQIARIDYKSTGTFTEKPVAIPPELVAESIDVTLENDGPDVYIDYHVYVAQ